MNTLLIAEGDKLALSVTVHRKAIATGVLGRWAWTFRIDTGRLAEIWEQEWAP